MSATQKSVDLRGAGGFPAHTASGAYRKIGLKPILLFLLFLSIISIRKPATDTADSGFSVVAAWKREARGHLPRGAGRA
jgi:hypothetical protein